MEINTVSYAEQTIIIEEQSFKLLLPIGAKIEDAKKALAGFNEGLKILEKEAKEREEAAKEDKEIEDVEVEKVEA